MDKYNVYPDNVIRFFHANRTSHPTAKLDLAGCLDRVWLRMFNRDCIKSFSSMNTKTIPTQDQRNKSYRHTNIIFMRITCAKI